MNDEERRDDETPANPDGPGGEAEEAAGSDSERRDDETPEAPEPEQPEGEAPEGEQPEGEAPEAEQPEAPEAEQPEAPEAEQPEAADDEPEPAEAEPEQPAETEAAAEKPEKVVPGAELDPIALEPERELSAEERARLEAEAEERARREAEATAEGGEEEAIRAKPAVDLDAETRIQATGKRKSSIARVIVRAGSGGFEVNERSLDEYFPRQYLRTLARQPLLTAGYEDSVDVRVRVQGGGVAGQAGAVRHGIARALCEIDPELRGELKRRGLLTRDARRKERRKAGLKKARKRPQFSKR